MEHLFIIRGDLDHDIAQNLADLTMATWPGTTATAIIIDELTNPSTRNQVILDIIMDLAPELYSHTTRR